MKVYLAQDATVALKGQTGHTYGLMQVGHREVLISFAMMTPEDRVLGLIRPNARRALAKRQAPGSRNMGRRK